MGPIGGEMRRLLRPREIDRILGAGAERARDVAAPTLAEVKRIVGYWAGWSLARGREPRHRRP